MTDIRVDEALWENAMLPEGIVERWFVSNGTEVIHGERVAEVRVEGALHEIMAPASGRLAIEVPVDAVIDPGARIGRVT